MRFCIRWVLHRVDIAYQNAAPELKRTVLCAPGAQPRNSASGSPFPSSCRLLHFRPLDFGSTGSAGRNRALSITTIDLIDCSEIGIIFVSELEHGMKHHEQVVDHWIHSGHGMLIFALGLRTPKDGTIYTIVFTVLCTMRQQATATTYLEALQQRGLCSTRA